MNLHFNYLRTAACSGGISVAFVVAMLIGCGPSSAVRPLRIQSVFAGYKLLRAGDLPDSASIHDLDSSKCPNLYPQDSLIIPGRAYIFRKDTTLDNEVLAMSILPMRLREAGAIITQAPRSTSDFMHLFIGGPLFSIKFEHGTHHGLIFNKVHASSQYEGNWEELIVILQ